MNGRIVRLRPRKRRKKHLNSTVRRGRVPFSPSGSITPDQVRTLLSLGCKSDSLPTTAWEASRAIAALSCARLRRKQKTAVG